MEDAELFQGFVAALRRGDEQAVVLLLRDYGPRLRRLIHARLEHMDLRRAVDTCDVEQSVLIKLLRGLAEGRYTFETPDDLRALLGRMVKNKILDITRKKRPVSLEDESPAAEPVTPDETPSKGAMHDEMIQRLLDDLPEWALRVFRWRGEGREWKEIGAELGKPSNAVRVRYEREMKRRMKRLD